MLAVAVEEVIGDHDGLHEGRAAGHDVSFQGSEIVGPEPLADRLDHLDRDDVIIAALDVAIVAELQVDAVGQPGPLQPRTRVFELLPGDRHAGHPHAATRRDLGEATPAAADLQDAVALTGAQLGEDALVLRDLGCFEGLLSSPS